jgi:hypothetical protein
MRHPHRPAARDSRYPLDESLARLAGWLVTVGGLAGKIGAGSRGHKPREDFMNPRSTQTFASHGVLIGTLILRLEKKRVGGEEPPPTRSLRYGLQKKS